MGFFFELGERKVYVAWPFPSNFLSQDINEEMTHTLVEKERKRKKERGRRRKGGSEGCEFQGGGMRTGD